MDQGWQRTKRTTPLNTKELIEELNPLSRGWVEYYKRAHIRKPFQRLDGWKGFRMRSEEHTSELQSRGHLVCRLLLEKKKKIYTNLYYNNQTRIARAADRA